DRTDESLFISGDRSESLSGSFKIRGKIEAIAAPVTDDSWLVDKQKTISWTVTGSVSKVMIYYSTDNFATVTRTVTTAAVNATDAGTPYVHPTAGSGKGTYLWTIPDDIQKEVWVKVLPTEPVATGFCTPATSGKFKIRGELKVTRPDASTYWICGTSEEIKWDVVGSGITRVNIAYIEYNSDNSVYEITTFDTNVVATDTVTGIAKYSRTYTWTVASDLSPYDPNVRVKIRVSDAGGNADDDVSDAYFEIRPRITITSPQAGYDWVIGNSYPISWTWEGPGTTPIKIELSKDNGAYEELTDISPIAASAGGVTWTAWDRISTNIKIRVSDVNNLTNVQSTSGQFTIRGAVNSIAQPTSGAKWLVQEPNKQIEWNQSGTFRVIVQHSKDDFTSVINALGEKDGVPGPNTFAWVPPNLTDYYGLGKIRIIDKNNSAVSRTMSASFKVLGALRLDQPNGGLTYEVDQDIPIGWTTVSGTGATIPNIDLHYSIDDGGTYPDPAQKIATYANPGVGVKTWKIPDKIGQIVRARVRDSAYPSDVLDQSDGSFKIKGKFVSVVSPTAGAEFTVGSPCTITWNTIGTFPDVKLQYSKNGGAGWTDITSINNPGGFSGTSTFVWNIPSGELADSSNCSVRVKTIDTDWQGLVMTSTQFTIKGNVAVATPNGSFDFTVAQTNRSITGTKSAGVNKIKLQWRKEGGAWNDITELTGLEGATTWSFNTWTIPDAISDNVQVRALDTSDLAIANPSEFITAGFDVRGKIEAVTNIATGDMLTVGSAKTISWTFTGTVTEVKLYYSTDNFATITKTIATVSMAVPKVPYSHPTAASGRHDYPWTVPDDIAPAVKIKVVPTLPETEGFSTPVLSNEFKIRGQFTSVQSPLTDAIWVVGEKTRVIRWRVLGGSMKNVRIAYKKTAASAEIEIVNSTPATSALFSAPYEYNGEYVWSGGVGVANAISNDVRILIYDVDNPAVFIESAPFNIRGALTAVYPNAGTEKWEVGQSYPITWNATGSIDFVRIEYSTNNGGNWETINNAYATVSGTNVYNPPNGWTVPNTITITSQALIRVTDNSAYTSDPDLICSDQSDNNFRVVGKLSFTSPSANYDVGEQINFQWTATGRITSVNLYYSTDNFATVTKTVQTGVASNPNGTTVYPWTIPNDFLAADLNKDLRFRVWDANVDTSVRVYTDTASTSRIHGKFTVTYPNPAVPGGIDWVVGETRPVTWTTVGEVYTVNVLYTIDGSNYTTFTGGAGVANTPTGTTGINVTVPDAIANTFKVRVVAASDSYARDDSNNEFNLRGKIEVLAPVTDTWQVSDTTREIVWRVTGSIPQVKVAYSINGGLDGYPNVITASTPATYTQITPPFLWEGKCYWVPSVPNVIGDLLRIKVSTIDGNWQNLAGYNPDNFKVRGKLEVVAPNSGETYWVYNNPRQTTLYPIQWRITGTVTSVKIGVSTNGAGGPFNTILITPTGGAGLYTYNWPVSDTVTTSGFIKIWDNDYPGDTPEPVNDVSNAAFNIKSKLELTAPITTTVWEVGQAGQFTWESAGSIGNVVLEYRNGSGSWVE
ncbi:MAG: hypothetical protein AB1599_09695, partial [Planctomycetota bacterium]